MKIIFLDADGTLFHPMGYIPTSSLKAIALAQKKGHKICLCTGRQRAEIYGDLAKVDYDGMVVGAGAYVEAKGKVLCDLAFTKEQRNELVDYFYGQGIPALFECSKMVLANQEAFDKINQLIDIQCKDLTQEQKEGHGLVRVLHSLTFETEENIRKAPVNKISFLESHISYQDTYNTFNKDYDIIPATFAPFGQESGEIANKSVSKGNGMNVLIDYYKIKEEDIIAIGDGYNDLSMFDRAHTSIAMGNAPLDIQNYCDLVTSSIDEDGIYKAFQQLEII